MFKLQRTLEKQKIQALWFFFFLKNNKILVSTCAALHIQAKIEFEELIASLKISKDNQQTPLPPAPPPTSQLDGPLSPQSFAMVSSGQQELVRIMDCILLDIGVLLQHPAKIKFTYLHS